MDKASAQQLPVFPMEDISRSLRATAHAFTMIADLAADAVEPDSQWLRELLATTEQMEDLTDSLLAEIRRSKHKLRCRLELK